MTLPHATSVGLMMAAGLLMTGLLTGIWKYMEIRRSPSAQAPIYVDIAHRAALMYAFAMTLLSLLTVRSALPPSMQRALLVALAACFAFSIGSYVLHGLLRDTDNQFRRPLRLGQRQLHHRSADVIMLIKSAIELGSVGWLAFGFWGAMP